MKRAALVLLLLLAGCSQPSPAPEPSSSARPLVTVATVSYGSIEQTVHATGTLVPPRDRQAVISPSVAGRLARLNVRVGARVRPGEVVAQLSTQAVDGQVEQARAAVAQNRVQVDQAEANYRQQQAQAGSAVLQAQAAVTSAQAGLTGARATLQADRSALDNARHNADRLRTLMGHGLVSTKDMEAADLAVTQAAAQVETQVQTVRASEQAVDSQRQALKAAQVSRLSAVVKQEDVTVAREQVRNAEGALQAAAGQAGLYTLRSPLDGQVTAVGASVGEAVDASTKVVSVADVSVLEMDLAVPARSRREVRVGMPVEARADDRPDVVLRGRLTLVQAQVEADSDTVMARSTVTTKGATNGSFVEADIVVARNPHALLVPVAALLNESDHHATVVAVDGHGLAHQVAVQVGLETATQAEVSGLQAGNRVAVAGGYGLPDGTEVQVSP